jgi:hypothetical protein
MKQYYEDDRVIFPFKNAMGISKSNPKLTFFDANGESFSVLDSERFVEEYRAWLDGGDENARN